MKQKIQLNADAVRFRERVGYSNREPIDIGSVVLKIENYSTVKLELPESLFHQFCNEAFREDMKNYYEEGEGVND